MIASDVGPTRLVRKLPKWIPLLLVGEIWLSSGTACRRRATPPVAATVTTDQDRTYPSAIDLTVRGAPSGAVVWYEGELLGPASRPVSLPYTVTSQDVTVKANGYEPITVTVVPDRPLEIVVNLKRLTGSGAATRPPANPSP